jgi:superfamily II DNA/RNA helicase
MEIIKRRGIFSHRFTMEEGTTPDKKYNSISERDFLLQKFAESKYQVLVAMKCLDEGVDIPPARAAILMASSGNPREYIQRIGRIIRRYPGKNEATIYDIVLVPSFDLLPPEFKDIEWKIFKKELLRCEEIANIAINNAEALRLIYDIKNRFMEMWT